MKIYLMRHLKVDFEWKKKYNSAEFDFDWNAYDFKPIIKSDKKLDLKIDKVFISELSRTAETAKVFALTQNIEHTALLDEVPMKSFFDTSFRLPLNIWLVIGRLQWYFNSKRQPESKTQTMQRVSEFIDKIHSENKNCLVIGHGFHFHQLKKQLQAHNYKANKRMNYKNGEVVEFKMKQCAN